MNGLGGGAGGCTGFGAAGVAPDAAVVGCSVGVGARVVVVRRGVVGVVDGSCVVVGFKVVGWTVLVRLFNTTGVHSGTARGPSYHSQAEMYQSKVYSCVRN